MTEEAQGCYVPPPDETVADGFGAHLELRDGAAVRTWSTSDGVDAPGAVERALDVAGAFISELRRTP